jgi:hypothetical protein
VPRHTEHFEGRHFRLCRFAVGTVGARSSCVESNRNWLVPSRTKGEALWNAEGPQIIVAGLLALSHIGVNPTKRTI